VRQMPDKCAVISNHHHVTFVAIYQFSIQIAGHIDRLWKGLHSPPEDETVVLLLDHGIEMVTGKIAILEADKIYVPFEPSHPLKRLMLTLEDCNAHLLVTDSRNLETAERLRDTAKHPVKILNIDNVEKSGPMRPPRQYTPKTDCPAYLLYTSGSTGTPKGVIQDHRNIHHFVRNYISDMEITEHDRLTLLSAFTHDAAVMDIYSGLLTGATLLLLNIKEADIPGLNQWLLRERITVWHSVPTLYRYFIESLDDDDVFPHLRLLVLGGEAITPEDIRLFRERFPGSVFASIYGQSESSYNAGFQIAGRDQPGILHLGNTIDGVELLVVDDEGEETEPFREGDLIVAGRYSAPGYWKNPGKTKECFDTDPELGRLYWTGDRARRLPDKTIQFIGRRDFQVKVRGFRVDPGESETALSTHPGIAEAVALPHEENDGTRCIAAYVVPKENTTVSAAQLREFLQQEIPDYMIPSYFVTVDRIPVTAGGKIDRNKLPNISNPMETGTEYVPPADELETLLVGIWRDVLS
ncbi:MAG: amino acid adenylation domain-containing protein, partial [bacterium]|nr:amino acid adenylation domain-containing protein [bacterium]